MDDISPPMKINGTVCSDCPRGSDVNAWRLTTMGAEVVVVVVGAVVVVVVVS